MHDNERPHAAPATHGADPSPARLSARLSASPVEVGSDELDMLARACRELAEDLAALAPGDLGQRHALLSERAGYLANAMRYMGLGDGADLFDRFAAGVDGSALDVGRVDDALEQTLARWPERWASWFEKRNETTLNDALMMHAAVPWQDDTLLEQARLSMSSLQLVGSRRTNRLPDDVTLQDMSLAIPADADPEVVDALLRELPQLANEFTDAVTAIAGNDFSALGDARRTAHTIKGSANTVGVVGVANLTHALEDLLQLIERAGGAPDVHVVDVLCVAADCLAELIESLSGVGNAPANALSVYQTVLAAVSELAEQLEARFQALALDVPDSTGYQEAVVGALQDEAPLQELVPSRDEAPLQDEDLASDDDAPPDGLQQPVFNILDFDLPDLELPDLNRNAGPAALPPAAPAPPGSSEPVGIEATLDVPVLGAASTWADWSVNTAGGLRTGAAGSTPVADDSLADESGDAVSSRFDTAVLRVPASIVEQLLESADEAVIALSELQDVVRELSASHHTLRDDSDRLDGLAVELDRLVDAASAGLPEPQQGGAFDPLELERYGEMHTVARRVTEAAADGKLLEQQIDSHLDRANAIVDKLERVQSLVRDNALRARMVEASSIASRLQRATRQAARHARKSVALTVNGGATAIDGDTLQRLVESLAHLVRNAVDHGIEPEGVRRAAGKPDAGDIAVTFEREVSAVTIIVEDDGAGLDVPAIESRARRLGLLPDAGKLDARAAAQLILAPGFTTRDAPTQLSGRGIGLDVVNQAVRGLRGSMSVTTEPGAGTRFEITLPLQLTSLSAFVLRSPTHVIAVSVRGVDEIVADTGAIEQGDDGLRLEWHGRRIEVRLLDQVLGLPGGMLSADPGASPHVLMIVRLAAGVSVGVLMPEPGQARQVVVRALPDYMPRIPGVDGVAVLGDGAVASVIDLPEMLASTAGAGPDPRRLGRVRQALPICLVVDDSVSVRRAMTHFMIDIGLHCEAAADGEEALVTLDRHVPDVVVLDLEMPRMNGIELTQALRRDTRTRSVPVIMITSRQSEKHRAMAMAAGVDVFLTKPYSEDELATVIGNALTAKPRD